MGRDLIKRKSDVHESIIVHILSFLPAKSIVRCSSVCRNWATLIFGDSYFSRMYSSTGKAPIHFLLNGTYAGQYQHLLLVEYDISSDLPVPITKSLLPNILDPRTCPHELQICSTCNFTGFVVTYAHPRKGNENWHPFHLFNPVTAQHLVVQQNRKDPSWRNSALVFAPKTNRLKLLKFIYNGTVLGVDIQTVGTNLWRTIGELQHTLYPHNIGFPVFLNGAYHWICHGWRASVIFVFNAEEEVFHHILTPSSTQDFFCSNIGLLDDCLCICMKEAKEFEFWVMNEYGVPGSWTKKFIVHNNLELNVHRIFQPLRCLENGEIIIICHDADVISYDPNTKSCKVIKRYYGKSPLTRKYLRKPPLKYKAIPYVPCFSRISELNGEILF